MTIYCTYNAATNALLGLSETPIEPADGQAVRALDRDMPDFALEAWNPAVLDFYTRPVTVLTKLQFMRRFTPAEYSGIKAAAALNGDVDYFWQMFMLAEGIVLDDPALVYGLSALEAAGLLAAGRSAEILT